MLAAILDFHEAMSSPKTGLLDCPVRFFAMDRIGIPANRRCPQRGGARRWAACTARPGSARADLLPGQFAGYPAGQRGNHMPFSLRDIHNVGEILAFTARAEIMPRFGKLTPAQVRCK